MVFLYIFFVFTFFAAVLWLILCANQLLELRRNLNARWGQLAEALAYRTQLLAEFLRLWQQVDAATLDTTIQQGMVTLLEQDAALEWDDVFRRVKLRSQLESLARHLFAAARQSSVLSQNPDAVTLYNTLQENAGAISDISLQYNRVVRSYNVSLYKLPYSLIARKIGLAKAPVYVEQTGA